MAVQHQSHVRKRWFWMVESSALVNILVLGSKHIVFLHTHFCAKFSKLVLLLTHLNILHRHVHHLDGDTGSDRLNFQIRHRIRLYSVVGFITAIVMGLSCLYVCTHLPALLDLGQCSETLNNSTAFNCSISHTTWSLLNHTLITSVVYTYMASHMIVTVLNGRNGT